MRFIASFVHVALVALSVPVLTAGELIVPEPASRQGREIKVLAESKREAPVKMLEELRKGPRPGVYLDGAGQLVLVGTDPEVHLLRGAAHVQTFERDGLVSVGAPCRLRERHPDEGRWRPARMLEGEGEITLEGGLRRYFYLDRSRMKEGALIRLQGTGRLVIRGFHAAVDMRLAEWGDRVREYRFPLPEKTAPKDEKKKNELRELLEQAGKLAVFGLL